MVHEPVGRMYVQKRDGRTESVYFDKITSRIEKLCYGLDMEWVVPTQITLRVIQNVYRGITTVELDNMAAEVAVSLAIAHPDYAILAARIAVSNLHKETKKVFSEVMSDLYNTIDETTGENCPLISKRHYDIIIKHVDRFNSAIVHERDFQYDYLAFKTLESSYLLRIKNKVVERPQQMLMRVSLGIHEDDIESAIETYNLLSERYYTHSSTTLLNAATPSSQLSSSFILTMKDDCLKAIYDTVKQCALISKSVGGIGLNIHCIRAKGSYIAGTKGISSGIVPMLCVFNNTALHVEQGRTSRTAAITVYLEPWHSDVFDFLDLKRNTGTEEGRARDLFYGMWIPDLFMKRVENDEEWSLMCPHYCPGLVDAWGEDFEKLYVSYEKEGKFRKKVQARQLWTAIIQSQIDTGCPYMLYKDTCNRKSNQKNIGIIKGASLSAGMVAYSSSDESASLNTASIAVNMFVKSNKTYDFEHLKSVTKIVTKNLNRVIDVTNYPIAEAETSNLKHRPIGIGIQGLADAFILMRMPYDSDEARFLNKQIFETMYYGALEASCELAEKHGAYKTYEGSPISKGILQFDMWETKPTDLWNWDELKQRISKYGVRNSLLLAINPTAAMAQILGNTESFEPCMSNVYTKKMSFGEFQIVNHHLLKDLIELGIWNDEIKEKLLANNGSVQDIEEVPDNIKKIYKTVWEISNKSVIEMVVDRGAYIDHSQSLSINCDSPTYKLLSTIHFYTWKAGLKTGMYMLRSKPTVSVQSK